MDSYLESDAFRDVAIARLSGAVNIPTQSFDDMGSIGEDPRWDIFYSFSDYLSKTYPLTHATLQLDKVNTHGLLYTWAGTDASLKPNLLMAHQDVVPVPDSTMKRMLISEQDVCLSALLIFSLLHSRMDTSTVFRTL